MPPFQHPIEIGPADGSRFQRLIAQVDASITYAVFPAPVLTMLGIEPAWSQAFQLAAGGETERQMAEIRVRLEGQERTTVCVFGGADSQPALGKAHPGSLRPRSRRRQREVGGGQVVLGVIPPLGPDSRRYTAWTIPPARKATVTTMTAAAARHRTGWYSKPKGVDSQPKTVNPVASGRTNKAAATNR